MFAHVPYDATSLNNFKIIIRHAYFFAVKISMLISNITEIKQHVREFLFQKKQQKQVFCSQKYLFT